MVCTYVPTYTFTFTFTRSTPPPTTNHQPPTTNATTQHQTHTHAQMRTPVHVGAQTIAVETANCEGSWGARPVVTARTCCHHCGPSRQAESGRPGHGKTRPRSTVACRWYMRCVTMMQARRHSRTAAHAPGLCTGHGCVAVRQRGATWAANAYGLGGAYTAPSSSWGTHRAPRFQSESLSSGSITRSQMLSSSSGCSGAGAGTGAGSAGCAPASDPARVPGRSAVWDAGE